MQTAVDYLIEQLQAPCRGIPSHIIEQAKQMHKTDTEKVWVAAVEYAISVLKDKISKESKEAFEQYYNETYGGGESNVLGEAPKYDFKWVCNECNSPNLTSSVSEDEIEMELHACINCGCFEMHKRYFH